MASQRNNNDLLFTPSRAPNHRQLRMGEEVRHILSTLFIRCAFPEPGLPTSITITQVKMSSDLQNATVYIMSLRGQCQEETLAYLKAHAGYIRYQLGQKLHSKFTPLLRFHLDESFEHAERIEELLKRT